MKKITTVSKYIGLIEQLRILYPNAGFSNNPCFSPFIFRGHSNENYKLLPGIYRKTGKEKTYLQWGSELGMLKHFIQEASVYINKPSDEYTSWMEYAQHYGVPTRLLDWTTNPLVALYFTCKNNEHDGEIWIVQSRNYDRCAFKNNEAFREFKGATRREAVEMALKEDISFDYPFIYTPFYVDARMSAQSSYFMVWGDKQETFEEMFADEKYRMKLDTPSVKTYGDKDEFLYSVKIPSSDKQSLLHELDVMGINEKTLFPGLDGIGRYIERQYRFDFNEYLQNI